MANEPHDRPEMGPDRRAALVHDLAVANDCVHDASAPHGGAAGDEHEIAQDPDREGKGPHTD